MKNVRYYYSPLARRIVFYVILVSTCVTLLTSAIQIYSEYKRDINGVNLRLEQLKTTQLSDIASRLWVMDTLELERTIQNLLELRSIEYIEVYDYDSLLMSAGNDFEKNAIVVNHPLKYIHNDETFNIGSIVIKASLDEVYSLIIDRALIIVFSNGFKTFIVAGFILFILYQFVGRHLLNISRHTQSVAFLNSETEIVLDRKQNNKSVDELDAVVNAVNTMRNELRSQLKETFNQKQYLSLTLNSIGDAVITTDTSGRIKRMNPVAEKLTGWSEVNASKLPISTVFQIIDSHSLEPIKNLESILIDGQKVTNLRNNTVLFSRDGSEHHISYTATPIKDELGENLGVVLIFHDVTEQYILREDIAKNKRDMQAIMDNSPAVVYIKDISGKYLFINRRYETLFDVIREDIVGKTDYDLFSKEIADELKRNDGNVKRAGHALEMEENVMHANGEIHTYISVKFPLVDENENIYAVCGISTDITDRKRQESNLRRAQKMDALGKLTSGIAHDFNNMLGIILGYAQLLEASLEKEPRIKNYASEIRRAGDRGTKLTKKLLDFSSQDTSDASHININNVLNDERQMLEKTLTARIKLELDLEKDLWISHLDAGELEDAIVNMCINSMHAIENKGTITISTRNRKLEYTDSEKLGLNPGDYVVVSIKDTGCGMDEHTKERIFDPFYSTKGEKGTGLGLSQVYGFVERSEGEIQVISSPGKGTTFHMYFPKANDFALDVLATDDNKSYNLFKGTETILIVDDEPSLLNLVNDSLTLHGYHVLTASNGQDALEILTKESVDLVISDIIMPKLDGTQLAREIRDRYPHVKMQMVSGYVENKITNLIDTSLSKNILYKPFMMEELINRVQCLLGENKDRISQL